VSKVAIVTDSTASVPPELKKQYGIEAVPLWLHLENKTYKDLVDIKTPAELFQLVDRSSSFPTTAAPAVGEFAEVYRKQGKKADSILTLTISSVLSATISSAAHAKELVKDELSNTAIEIFDSMSSVGGLGLMVIAAARAAAAGEDVAAVAKAAEKVKSSIIHLYVFNTLTYLARSGRISKAAAMAGNMLSMKPITEMPTSLGRAVVVARPRTKKKALQVLLGMVRDKIKPGRKLRVLVEHVCAAEEAESIKGIVSDQFDCAEVLICEYSPVSSLIVGPGVVGLSCYQE